MQSTRKNVKKVVFTLVSLVVLAYVGLLIFVHSFPPKYANCERYTKDLNGGIKTIGARKYNVKMCGTGGDENSNEDEIELTVSSEQGELLAKRHFMVHWMANFHEPLEYQEDQLIYYDFSTHNNFKKSVTIPPTTIDWLRARLPFFN
jgi:hypothetical protein